jgi:hypothetical protein
MTEIFLVAMEDTSACDRVWKMYRKLAVSRVGANKNGKGWPIEKFSAFDQ